MPLPTNGQSSKRPNIVMTPLFERVLAQDEDASRIQQQYADLQAATEQLRAKCGLFREKPPSNNSPASNLKRKASDHPLDGLESIEENEPTAGDLLARLSNELRDELSNVTPNETIHLCGFGPLQALASRPFEVWELAREKLHTWPYSRVPVCWRRLLEDATLAKVARMLILRAVAVEGLTSKRRMISASERQNATTSPDRWFADVVRELDVGMSMSGTPGRRSTFEHAFRKLEKLLPQDAVPQVASNFGIERPNKIQLGSPTAHENEPLTFEAFQSHLDHKTTPLIIPGALEHWPASTEWQNPNYFLGRTLGGHRVVPIELGKMYTDAEWSQRLMPFHEFLTNYLLPANPDEIGYLAQHDLFSQIPSLRSDFSIPDYCYTTPPPPTGAVSHTSGLGTTPQLDEPQLNVWFGPKGTKTPLHTDPYHNILCQVVGYKFVLLFPPSDTGKLYPRGENENGVSMANTSQLDVSSMCPRELLFRSGSSSPTDSVTGARCDLFERFPAFAGTDHLEAILGPGESLYVPLGWWHYVESLTTSISVSFWWN
ncbi:uncharacterized protein LTR77_000790 [Saxophila tyrrhenica]|uniref:JmjC domain-containing protein n=1 Tax=Saxophila tyrrhenica TaxID=1690608 RepID=A0AAV9PPB5_9PEZI|nr:hypothetical protein LTR77_000790 [Saxophila tyrrhenica]